MKLDDLRKLCEDVGTWESLQKNSEFILAARTAMPYLIDVAISLKEARKHRLLAGIEGYGEGSPGSLWAPLNRAFKIIDIIEASP